MTQSMTQEDRALARAEEHVKRVRDFFYHLMTYVLVCALLVFIDLRVDTGGPQVMGLDWAYWVIWAWGFGILGHAVYVFFGDYRVRMAYDRERSRSAESR